MLRKKEDLHGRSCIESTSASVGRVCEVFPESKGSAGFSIDVVRSFPLLVARDFSPADPEPSGISDCRRWTGGAIAVETSVPDVLFAGPGTLKGVLKGVLNALPRDCFNPAARTIY